MAKFNKTKGSRLIEQIINEFNLKILDARIGGGGHYRYQVQTPDGRTALLFCALSPSDHRVPEHIRRDCRSILRGAK